MNSTLRALIRRMTVEEKVYQMASLLDPVDGYLTDGKAAPEPTDKMKRFIARGLGGLGVVTRTLGPRETATLTNAIQTYALQHSRLKIPLLIHEETLHGCTAKGSTVFPQAIGMASAWDPALHEKIARAIGRETRARGIHQGLAPTINLASDPRNGRTEETYGEDSFLTGELAYAYITGLQRERVAATPKHFAANFAAPGGRDCGAVHLSERILREQFLPHFKRAIVDAGALSIMAAYNSINGMPCSADRWLLTDLLRNEWGFKGMVVSDYNSVEMIQTYHGAAGSKGEALARAVAAGLDMELPNPDCAEEFIRLIKARKFPIALVNTAVERILIVKEKLGLFNNPFVRPARAAVVSQNNAHTALAAESARASMVLLKNNGVLPLSKKASVAVIGPNADAVRYGGYSVSAVQGGISVLNGITQVSGGPVRYALGCDIDGDSREGFAEAVAAARASTVAVLCMGNSEKTEGENKDRHNLDLPGVQQALIHEIVATGVPVVVVLINGSAVTMMQWHDAASAIVEAWYPGQEGGAALAQVLYGSVNPSGKLPISFPKYASQLPVTYNQYPTGRLPDYVDLRGEQAWYPFGWGLSYTIFSYRDLVATYAKGTVVVSVIVANEGSRAGDEVVQLYVRDREASLARPRCELKGFKKLWLKPGEKKRVRFTLTKADLSFLDARCNMRFEPGVFTCMVGGNSRDTIAQDILVS